MQKSKGFTLIELIVVIAIIAVLAAIVSVNVVTYLKKGQDAAIKSNLGTLMAEGVSYLGDTPGGSFTCTATVLTAIGQITSNYDCASAAGVFAACAELPTATTTYWCIDSTGTKGVKLDTGTPCTSSWNLTACPSI